MDQNQIKKETVDEHDQFILLVGEGNFSYSAALSSSILSIPNSNITHSESSKEKAKNYRIIATDLKPNSQIEDELTLQNIIEIKRNNKGLVFIDVDATKLEQHKELVKYTKYIDKIIFNFPHVQRKKMHIGANRELLKRFFISANKLIPQERNDVEVTISLCSGQSGINEIEIKSRVWGDSWQIVDQAAYGNFVLVKIEDFDIDNQESYINCGYRDRPNVSFHSKDAKTFTFLKRDSLSLEKEWESIDSFDFLKTLHFSNPLVQIVKNVIQSCTDVKLIKKINFNQTKDCSFIELWVEDLNVNDLNDNLQFLKFESDDDFNVSVFYSNVKVGFITKSKECEDKLSLNLSLIVILKYDISDSRILFSKYCHSLDVPRENKIITGSLYPCTFSIDISFWINISNYSYPQFVECCLKVYHLLLKSVKLLEVYQKPLELDGDDKNRKRLSHCYRVTIQSVDLGLSRSKANEYYLKLRNVISEDLDVELR